MKTILFITILFHAILNAKSSDFSVIVKQPFDAALFSITEDYDRDISAVGFSKNFKQDAQESQTFTNAFDYLASVSNSYGTQMQLIKVDKNADIILSKKFKLSKYNKAVAVVKTPSNGYFVGGYTLDGELLVSKLDANANLIFTKIFGTKNYDRMHNLVLMSDGGVLAVGSSITSRSSQDKLFETGLGNNDIYITRFSKNGHKLWSKKYGTEHDDEGIDAVEAQDGSIIVLSNTSYDKHRDVTFMRLDENGNRIWLKHYKGENLTIPKKIIRLKDNNFVVSLVQYNEMHREHVRLIKFDLYKNILIDREIPTTYASGLNDIKEFSDGSLIGVGYVKDTHNTDGLAMLFDSNLRMLRQEHYGKENFDLFYAAKILHNSQVAIAGLHTDDDSQESNMWITKLNRDISVAQASPNSTNFYKKLLVIFEDEIQAGELSIREDLTIEFLDKKLYFEVGVYKLSKTQEIFLAKFSKKLLPFLLQNKEHISTLEVNGHTSSEWGSTDFAQTYLNNKKLSMERSFSTLSYIFKTQAQTTQEWLTEILRGSGYSYSKNVMFNEVENKKESRRVTFKVILKQK